MSRDRDVSLAVESGELRRLIEMSQVTSSPATVTATTTRAGARAGSVGRAREHTGVTTRRTGTPESSTRVAPSSPRSPTSS